MKIVYFYKDLRKDLTMRKILILLVVFGFLANVSCKKENDAKKEEKLTAKATTQKTYTYTGIPFDSTLVKDFFVKYPKLVSQQADVEALYKKHQFQYIWYDKKGLNELGDLLYNKIKNLADEGVQASVPYKDKLDAVLQKASKVKKPDINTELLLTSLYFFYAEKVYNGIDVEKTNELGWYLPRKNQEYGAYLDSLLTNPSLINKNENEVVPQYYKLKEILKKYRQIEKNGGWNTIVLDTSETSFKPGDSSKTIAQIRHRLLITGDVSSDSESTLYDDDLAKGIIKFKQRHSFKEDNIITAKHLRAMNVPVGERIKTIMVNMERCRWISPDIIKSKELIVINIPAYRLSYFKEGKLELAMKVVVGKDMNQTVVFSGEMKYIVFRPYWNLPRSIIKKEIKPAMAKNKNYLSEHNMEWNGGNIRQKPGPKNSLGLVKFLFPNTNDIYLHDTPSKSLFNEEKRAFSHGCIRVAKPRQLANIIMKDDKNWSPEKIDAAMDNGTEKWYTLKNTIPVYIGYFTAWVDNEGDIHFYDDVYSRDQRLASLIFTN